MNNINLFKIKSLDVYCDASYYDEYHRGIIAFVIYNQNGKLIYKKNKMVDLLSVTEGEYLAIGMAVRRINFYQKTNLITNRIHINIIGDNQGVIKYINNFPNGKCKSVKGKDLELYNKEIKALKMNNKVMFKWKSRTENKIADRHTRPSCLFAMI